MKVSYRLSQFGALDNDINRRTDALRDVAFPTLSKESAAALTSSGKYKNKLKDLEHCRMSLEQWVYYVVTRIEVVPDDLRDAIEAFFCLPSGPNAATHDNLFMSPPPGDGYHPPIASLASLRVNPSLLSSPAPSEFDDTASEVTTGSIDEYGLPKKKKKRIIKGAKRRLSKAFGMGGASKKESLGDGEEGGYSPNAKSPTASSVLSGTSTAYSMSEATMSPSERVLGEVQSVQPGKLIKVCIPPPPSTSVGDRIG